MPHHGSHLSYEARVQRTNPPVTRAVTDRSPHYGPIWYCQDSRVRSTRQMPHYRGVGRVLPPGARSTVRTVDWRLELERLHTRSYAWALYCCRQRRAEAQDVLQDVYVRVLDGRAQFAGKSSVKTWLFGLIRRTARDQNRRQWLRAALLERWITRSRQRAALRARARTLRVRGQRPVARGARPAVITSAAGAASGVLPGPDRRGSRRTAPDLPGQRPHALRAR